MHIIFDYENGLQFFPLCGDGEPIALRSRNRDFNYFIEEWSEMKKKHFNNKITDE